MMSESLLVDLYPFFYTFVFFLGLIIGSFLNVVIFRMHTGESLQGRSRCLSCGETLRWWHLLPIASLLVLRARCGFCGARISLRYAFVELLTAFFFLKIALFVLNPWLLIPYLFLAAVLVVILVYDILHTIIPDECIIFLALASMLIIGISIIFAPFDTVALYMFLTKVLGAAVGFLFFAGLWYLSEGKWVGFGDAKLALPLGFLVGLSGTFSMIILAFWIGACVGVLLLALTHVRTLLIRRGQIRLPFLQNTITMKSEVPFAPFLIIGFLLVHFYAVDVFVLTERMLSVFL